MAKIYCVARGGFNKIINLDHVNEIKFDHDDNAIEFYFQNKEISTVHFNSLNDLLNEYEIIKQIMRAN